MFVSVLAQKLRHQMQIYDIYPVRKFWESATIYCLGNKIVLIFYIVQKNNYRRDEVPWWLQNADLTLFSSSLNTFFVSKIKNTSLQMQ